MDVCLLWVLGVVMYRSLRRADHSSRGVLLTVVCRCVWSKSLKNEEARAGIGSHCHRKKKIMKSYFTATLMLPYVRYVLQRNLFTPLRKVETVTQSVFVKWILVRKRFAKISCIRFVESLTNGLFAYNIWTKFNSLTQQFFGISTTIDTWATCFDSIESSSGPQRLQIQFYLVKLDL